MDIDLAKLNFAFSTKPLLIGGMAMQYYDLRPSGRDIDLVITPEDYRRLAAQYPDHLKEIGGDLGVCVYEFEIWKSICLYGYDHLAQGAVDAGDYLVISLEKLLLLKALAMRVEKYHRDLELIVQRLIDMQYANYTPTPA